MDRDVDVRTPESIAFTYQLAGLGSRFLAYAIDLLLQIGIVLAIFGGIAIIGARLPADSGSGLGKGSDPSLEKIAAGLIIAMVVVLFFTIFFGYFIAFETFWNGQTPGKKALGIRVVRDGGYGNDFGAALIRNLIRVGEMALGFYLMSAISMLISRENKRLGDWAAGTIVVRDERVALAPQLLEKLKQQAEPAYASTMYLTGEERALIKRFLDRRGALTQQRRFELAAALASRVRSRVPPDLARLDDESLLERL